jgi:hypothetical protein
VEIIAKGDRMVCKKCGYDYCIGHYTGNVIMTDVGYRNQMICYPDGMIGFSELEASGFYESKAKRP